MEPLQPHCKAMEFVVNAIQIVNYVVIKLISVLNAIHLSSYTYRNVLLIVLLLRFLNILYQYF